MPSRDDELFELIHSPTGVAVASRVVRARGLAGKGLGLIGRVELAPSGGLWLQNTSAIHTLGMRFALDVLFLDRDARTVGIERRVPANRIYCGKRGASSVIELAAGALEQIPQIAPGDPWNLRPRGRE